MSGRQDPLAIVILHFVQVFPRFLLVGVMPSYVFIFLEMKMSEFARMDQCND